VCFSPEADIVAGVIVTAIGFDTIRHVGHDRESAMAALPVIFGLHQLIEVPVWWAVESRVPMALGRGAAWLYLAIAFGLIPWAVPYAVRRLEVDQRRRTLMAALVALGVIVAVSLTIPILSASISVVNAGNYLEYSASLFLGGALSVLYVAATCGSMILSSDRVVVVYGWMNLVTVSVLAVLLRSGVISLWCVWAAVTSIAIAVHLHRLHRQHEGRVVLAGA
jgi:hypothetical protein